MGPAVEQFLRAHQLAVATVAAAGTYLDEALGIAYLHKAEMDSGVYRSPGDYVCSDAPWSCIREDD